MDSWIKLFRKFRDWEWYSDINVSRVFLELLLTVNFEDKKWHGIDINRGSIITSVGNLALTSKLSHQQVRTSLDKLKSTNEITIKTTNKYTLITINKYNEYQEINKQPNKQITNHQQTNNKQVTTTKEYNNIRIKELKNNKYSELTLLTEENFEDISNKYQVPVSFVRSKYDDLINWHEKNPQKNYYKNYLSALRDWVKRDMLKIKTEYGKQNSEVSI